MSNYDETNPASFIEYAAKLENIEPANLIGYYHVYSVYDSDDEHFETWDDALAAYERRKANGEDARLWVCVYDKTGVCLDDVFQDCVRSCGIPV